MLRPERRLLAGLFEIAFVQICQGELKPRPTARANCGCRGAARCSLAANNADAQGRVSTLTSDWVDSLTGRTDASHDHI